MKCSELQTGDYVRLKHAKEVVWVFEIDDDRNVINNESDGYCSEKNIAVDDVEPIPLTKEILEKNGFKKEWDEDIVLMVCDTIIVEIGDNYKLYKDGKMYLRRVLAPLYYVHELQHALRLCGIEKEIIL